MQEQDTGSQGESGEMGNYVSMSRFRPIGHTDMDTLDTHNIVIRGECGPHPLCPLSPGQRQQPLSGEFNE